MSEPTSAGPRPLRDALADELRALCEDILWTEKTHFAHADTYARIHFSLGGLATVAGAAAATSVVATGAPALTAILAVVGAVASAVVTFVKPQETQQKYLLAGRRLGELRVQIRQTLNLDLHAEAPAPEEDLRRLVAELSTHKAQIDQSAPITSNRAFQKARKKIESGGFEHGASGL